MSLASIADKKFSLLQGKSNCLANLTFLRTGVLDSLETEEFENLIKQYGGKVVQGVSSELHYNKIYPK